MIEHTCSQLIEHTCSQVIEHTRSQLIEHKECQSASGYWSYCPKSTGSARWRPFWGFGETWERVSVGKVSRLVVVWSFACCVISTLVFACREMSPNASRGRRRKPSSGVVAVSEVEVLAGVAMRTRQCQCQPRPELRALLEPCRWNLDHSRPSPAAASPTDVAWLLTIPSPLSYLTLI